jgi:hypothetical protein
LSAFSNKELDCLPLMAIPTNQHVMGIDSAKLAIKTAFIKHVVVH